VGPSWLAGKRALAVRRIAATERREPPRIRSQGAGTRSRKACRAASPAAQEARKPPRFSALRPSLSYGREGNNGLSRAEEKSGDDA